MFSMEVLDMDNRVIVVTEQDESEVITVESGMLIYSENIGDEFYEYAVENTDYDRSYLTKEDIDWPLQFCVNHHLEDRLWRPAYDVLEGEVGSHVADEIFEDMSIEKPSIEISSYFLLFSDGSVELNYVEYNDCEYTAEEVTKP